MERNGLVLGQADVEVRRYMGRTLAEFGLVGETGDGEELLRLAREKDPALVVMDLRLTGKDGLEILPELRKSTAGKILVVGSISMELMGRALELGADSCVVLPCSGEALRQAAQTLLKNE